MADEHNMKPRLIYCPKCRKEETSDALNPVCASCNVGMKSVIDGEYFHRRLKIPSLWHPEDRK